MQQPMISPACAWGGMMPGRSSCGGRCSSGAAVAAAHSGLHSAQVRGAYACSLGARAWHFFRGAAAVAGDAAAAQSWWFASGCIRHR
jgi:hypothetical protein